MTDARLPMLGHALAYDFTFRLHSQHAWYSVP